MRGVLRALYLDLTSGARQNAAATAPFDMDDGLLGDAYTASAVFWSTREQRWLDLAQSKVDSMVEIVRGAPVGHDGILGGYAGLAYLLQMSATALSTPVDFLQVLDRRTEAYSTVTMGRIFTDGQLVRRRFGYAQSLAGVAHLKLQAPETVRQAERICRFLADLAYRPFPGPFWSPRGDLGEEVIRGFPDLAFGGRDLGFHSGVAGVISVLLEAAAITGEEEYRSAAVDLTGQVLDDLAAHSGTGLSRYQRPPFHRCDRRGPVSPFTWGEGIPGLQLAVSWDVALDREVREALRYTDEYFVPEMGGFRRPGLTDGVAGRLYIADEVQLPSYSGWVPYLESALEAYAAGHAEDVTRKPGSGFLTGIGGVVAVLLGHRSRSRDGSRRGYAPILSVLGTSGG
jgi:hypothetical protein